MLIVNDPKTGIMSIWSDNGVFTSFPPAAFTDSCGKLYSSDKEPIKWNPEWWIIHPEVDGRRTFELRHDIDPGCEVDPIVLPMIDA